NQQGSIKPATSTATPVAATAATASTTSPSNMVSTEQSQKLIQTMLTMTIGCICFLRGLFNDSVFIDQRFVPGKFEPNYKAKNSNVDSLRVKTLVRGRSKRVDTLLNWIDKGCIDAIRKSYLKGMTFGVFTDKAEPEVLKEAYTLWFQYSSEECVSFGLSSSKQGNSSTIGEGFTVLSSRQALQGLMKRLIILTQSMDSYPEASKKYISMRLLFNDSCPADYQPPYFKDASTKKPVVVRGNVDGMGEDRFSLGHVKTGRHGVCVNILTEAAVCDEEHPEAFTDLDPFDFPVLPENSKLDQGFEATRQKPLSAAISKTYKKKMEGSLETQVATQVTKELKSFLTSNTEHEHIPPTQSAESQSPQPLIPNSTHSCECGSKKDLSNSENLTCTGCSGLKHSYCYAADVDRLGKRNLRSFERKFICLNCQLTGSTEDSHNTAALKKIQLLTNARKVYYIFKELKDTIPESFKALVQLCGLETNDDSHSAIIASIITTFASNGILHLSETPKFTGQGDSFVHGSGWFTFTNSEFNIDDVQCEEMKEDMSALKVKLRQDGVSLQNGGTLKIGMTFTPRIGHTSDALRNFKTRGATFKDRELIDPHLRYLVNVLKSTAFIRDTGKSKVSEQVHSQSSNEKHREAAEEYDYDEHDITTKSHYDPDVDFSRTGIADSTQDSIIPPTIPLEMFENIDGLLSESLINVSQTLGPATQTKILPTQLNSLKIGRRNEIKDDPIIDSLQSSDGFASLPMTSQPVQVNTHGNHKRLNHVIEDDDQDDDVVLTKVVKIRKISEGKRDSKGYIHAGEGHQVVVVNLDLNEIGTVLLLLMAIHLLLFNYYNPTYIYNINTSIAIVRTSIQSVLLLNH
ncbi:hypothetical protein WICPIJ_007494, partial [Wickerhamomyces pijperi]